MDCCVARALYEDGFSSPLVVAAAPKAELLKTLRKTLPPNVPWTRGDRETYWFLLGFARESRARKQMKRFVRLSLLDVCDPR